MTGKLTLRPLGIGDRAAGGLPLAGGPRGFTACEAVFRDDDRDDDRDGPREVVREVAREVVPLAEVGDWAARFGPEAAAEAQDLLGRLSAPRPPFAGLRLTAPRVIGVINVTPDSFSDGGDRFDSAAAVADGLSMLEAGAAILDVGGESTRPGAAPVTEEEELRRVIPVVRALSESGALVSIDTCRVRVMAAALEAGARIINDITALAGDPRSLELAAETGVPVVLMHMQGEPRTMQQNPTYGNAPLEVYDFLAKRVAACEAAGMERARVAVDPGIGFGKTVAHNLQILDQMALYHGLGCPVLLGVSRKSFIARLSRDEPPKARVPGSLAAALAGLERGVQMIRAHDVAETAQALAVWHAIAAAGQPQVAPSR